MPPDDATTPPTSPSPPAWPRLFAALAGPLADEWLQVAYVDAAGALLWLSPLRPGGVDGVGLPIRSIIANALQASGCTGLVLAHNHPSGDPAPSARDIAATRQLADIARRLELRVVDHFILAGDRWTNFRGLGLL